MGAPADAAGFARRGAAFASRRDFEHALLDFNRACELAPNEPSYYYRRGLVRYSMRQPEQGANDIDQALKLKPDYVDALMARAQIQLYKHNASAAVVDLDAVDRVVPKEANVRLQLTTWPSARRPSRKRLSVNSRLISPQIPTFNCRRSWS